MNANWIVIGYGSGQVYGLIERDIRKSNSRIFIDFRTIKTNMDPRQDSLLEDFPFSITLSASDYNHSINSINFYIDLNFQNGWFYDYFRWNVNWKFSDMSPGCTKSQIEAWVFIFFAAEDLLNHFDSTFEPQREVKFSF